MNEAAEGEVGLSYTRNQQQQVLKSESSSATTTLTSVASGGNNAPQKQVYLQTDTQVKRSTPVLFCTNRGLYLRLPKSPAATLSSINDASSSQSSKNINLYDFKFCDLERWSTNRANTINLDDTIASRTFTLQRQNSLLPTKQSMVRFNTSYSVFEEQ